MRAPLLFLLGALALGTMGCDGGLAPPPEAPPGAVAGTVTYRGAWPPPDSVRDVRFVALRFVPRDSADFFQPNRMIFTDRLRTRVPRDTFVVGEVEPGVFLYSGIAVRYGGPLDWRPVGLVRSADGFLEVLPGETTFVEVDVDFSTPPVFPPTGDRPPADGA